MRKMMALILAITLTLGMLPISAFAAEPEETAEHAETAPETEAAAEPETLPPETVPETVPPETEPEFQQETTVPTEAVTEPTAEATEPVETEETIPEETTVPEETEEEAALPEGLRFELPPAEPIPCEDFENRIQPPFYFYRLALNEKAEIYEGPAEISIVAGSSVSLENATVTAEKAGVTVLALTGEGIPACNTAYVIAEVVDGTQADLAIQTSLVEDFEVPELGRDQTMGSCICFYEGADTRLDFTVSAPGAAYLSVSVNGGEWNTKEGADAVFTAQLENRQNIIGIRAFDAEGRAATFYKTVDARLCVKEAEIPEEPTEETLPQVCKEVLTAWIERASEKAEADCTPEEWAAIQAALENARLVLENAEAAQSEVDGAIEALSAALGEAPQEETEPTEPPAQPEEETQPEEDYDYALGKADETDLAEAEAVMELIRDMGDDPRAIRLARAAYNGLTNLQQALVQNYRQLLDAEEAAAQLRATLTLPGEVTGRPGTAFSAMVSVEGWNNTECYQVLDCTAEIPKELEVADVTMSERISGGSVLWNVSETDGLLRIVYTALSGEALVIDGETFPAELFSIDMKVKEDTGISDATELQLGLREMSLKAAPVLSLLSLDEEEEESADGAFCVNIEDAVGVLYLIPGEQVSYRAVKLYQGDGEDLIARGQKAVCVSVAGSDAGKLTFQYDGRETTFFYSEDISSKSQTPSYVAVVDADVPMEVFNQAEFYTASKYEADKLMFGDANGDGTIDAQDALAALDIWLDREGGELEDDAILRLNVNGDSRVNTSDALSILEYVVSGREFPIVTKAAGGGIAQRAEQTTEKQSQQ